MSMNPPQSQPWFNIQRPLPQTGTACVGPNCYPQTVAPRPTPPKEDWRLNPPLPRPKPPQQVEKPEKPVVQKPAPAPTCTAQSLNPNKISSQLDVLLVMDTSASMRGGYENGTGGELGMIIPEMSSFVKQLNPNTDVRIGMILGHARPNARSPHNIHGKLFQVDGSDPAVIDYAKIRKSCPQNNELDKCVNNKVANILKRKLRNIPNDHTEAQGEALFSSLYDALTDAKLKANIAKAGLFRPDATLAVITLSDEQEVCWDYDKWNQAHPKEQYFPANVHYGPKDKKTGQQKIGPDPHEAAFFKNDCPTLANGRPMSADEVWHALLDLKGGKQEKLVITGVHYLNNDIPTELQDHYFEMEMGHGYLDLIEMAQGHPANMAAVDRKNKVISFSNEMADIGKFAAFKMEYKGDFTCDTKFPLDQINPTSVELHIFDTAKNQDVAVFSAACVQQPCTGNFTGPATVTDKTNKHSGRHEKFQVSVDPELLKKALDEQGLQSAEARITFEPYQSSAQK
jgi:hypothetical protein